MFYCSFIKLLIHELCMLSWLDNLVGEPFTISYWFFLILLLNFSVDRLFCSEIWRSQLVIRLLCRYWFLIEELFLPSELDNFSVAEIGKQSKCGWRIRYNYKRLSHHRRLNTLGSRRYYMDISLCLDLSMPDSCRKQLANWKASFFWLLKFNALHESFSFSMVSLQHEFSSYEFSAKCFSSS